MVTGAVYFDGDIFWRQRHGGISRYFCSLALALTRRGVAATINARAYRSRLLPQMPTDLVRGFPMPGPDWLSLRLAAAANAGWVSETFQTLARPTIIHHTYYPALNPRRTGGCQRVVTVHDMIPELMPHLVPGEERTVAAKRRAIMAADHVICVSENTRADLLNLTNLSADRVSVVYLGADDLPDPANVPVPDLPEAPFILFVGGRGGYKNFSTLADAFGSARQLPREMLLLAFGGGAFTRQEWEHFDRLGISTRVRQCDGDDHMLVTLLRTALVLVYPSLYEGFGLPPLEGLAQGCPVISSNAASMPEVLGDAVVFFDPNNREALASHLDRMATDTNFRLQMSERGRSHARRFSWKTCAAQTARIYEALTS